MKKRIEDANRGHSPGIRKTKLCDTTLIVQHTRDSADVHTHDSADGHTRDSADMHTRDSANLCTHEEKALVWHVLRKCSRDMSCVSQSV